MLGSMSAQTSRTLRMAYLLHECSTHWMAHIGGSVAQGEGSLREVKYYWWKYFCLFCFFLGKVLDLVHDRIFYHRKKQLLCCTETCFSAIKTEENEEDLEKGDLCQLQSAVYEIHSLTIHISGLVSEQVFCWSHLDSRPQVLQLCPHKVHQSWAILDVWEWVWTNVIFPLSWVFSLLLIGWQHLEKTALSLRGTLTSE